MRLAPLLALLLLGACVERRLLVRTDPPGAEVRINGDKVGRSPTRWSFEHYGKALVEVEKPGYEPARQVVELRAPWYEMPGADLVSDVLLPARIEDDHEVVIKLAPMRRLSDRDVDRAISETARAADKWRKESEASR